MPAMNALFNTSARGLGTFAQHTVSVFTRNLSSWVRVFEEADNSAGCQQYTRTSVYTAALFLPLSASIGTILARMSTSGRMFLFGGESEGEEGQKSISPPKMCFIQTCIQQMYQLRVPQTGGPSANPRLPSQGYQFERKIQGTQTVPLVAFIGLIFLCSPKWARGGVSQQHHTDFYEQGLGLSVLYLEKGTLTGDTLSILDMILLSHSCPFSRAPPLYL